MATATPKRRFAPIPIETTFESVRSTHGRQGGWPNPELTPEPSPRSASPTRDLQRERRRFKPQLIETSRRTRRVGNPGPATRPTDKTDITPYTNHIYVVKPKPKVRRKRGDVGEQTGERVLPPPTRRETEDEGVTQYLLELAAAQAAARQVEEAALAAFPNSRAREGGVAHFYFSEGSDSDHSPGQASPEMQEAGAKPRAARVRRKSSSIDLNWWQRHMQDHAEQLAHERGGDEMDVDVEVDNHKHDGILRTDSDLDRMDLPAPPDDALWTTTNRRDSGGSRASSFQVQDLRDSLAPLLGTDGRTVADAGADRAIPGQQHHHEQHPHGFTPAPASGFGRPFGAFGLQPEDPQLHRLRQAASPPMLGKDLTFRRCPSPKHTKLETDHPFAAHETLKDRAANRDENSTGGLWRGFCYRTESNDGYVVPSDLRHGAGLLVTPFPPGSPRAEDETDTSRAVSSEPEPLSSSQSSESSFGLLVQLGQSRHPKGLHMLHGLDERLRREKAQAELDEQIAIEFDDGFVTQVYNYLSLGYPSMAHSFDDELSKISRLPIEELSRDDDKATFAKGFMLEMGPDDERCPRWKALRVYITEWAKQHPDQGGLDPLAGWVHERRGSWAI